jgi:hypothetical protein
MQNPVIKIIETWVIPSQINLSMMAADTSFNENLTLYASVS